MKIKDLIEEWEDEASEPLTANEYHLRLPVYAAAKVAALAEMYPGRAENQILTDLIDAALNEFVEALPYIKGTKITDYDEEGDPIHEDAGLAPQFLELTNTHLARLKKEAADSE